MISANFAVAVVTVVLRGLLDRILIAAPIVRSPLISSSTGLVLLSGTAYLLYNHLVNRRRIRISYTSPQRRSKILDGCIHKNNGSRASSLCNLREHRSWCPRKFRSTRSKSRYQDNLLEAAKDSLQMLHREGSSSCSLSSKSMSSVKCRCIKENSIDERDEKQNRSPSVFSIKSDTENLDDREIGKNDESNLDYKGYGDCDWEDQRPKVRRRRKIRTTRKTRSGKIYSTYL